MRWNPPISWSFSSPESSSKLNGRKVTVQAWKYTIKASHDPGSPFPVFFLDTDVPENERRPPDRPTQLYSGDQRHRLTGGALRNRRHLHAPALGCRDTHHHMNERPRRVVTIELLVEHSFKRKTKCRSEVIAATRQSYAFTTRTPSPPGTTTSTLLDGF